MTNRLTELEFIKREFDLTRELLKDHHRILTDHIHTDDERNDHIARELVMQNAKVNEVHQSIHRGLWLAKWALSGSGAGGLALAAWLAFG